MLSACQVLEYFVLHLFLSDRLLEAQFPECHKSQVAQPSACVMGLINKENLKRVDSSSRRQTRDATHKYRAYEFTSARAQSIPQFRPRAQLVAVRSRLCSGYRRLQRRATGTASRAQGISSNEDDNRDSSASARLARNQAGAGIDSDSLTKYSTSLEEQTLRTRRQESNFEDESTRTRVESTRHRRVKETGGRHK